MCPTCKKPIGDKPFIQAGKFKFHDPQCFRCSKCTLKIVDLKFKPLKDGGLMCRNCCLPICYGCKGKIEGHQIV